MPSAVHTTSQRAGDEWLAIEARLADFERQMAATQAVRQNRTSDATGATLRSTAQLEARAGLAVAELDAARLQFERSRELYSVGLLPSPVLREHEARVTAAERGAAALGVEIRSYRQGGGGA